MSADTIAMAENHAVFESALVSALADKYQTSSASAQRTVTRHFTTEDPNEAACEKEMAVKRCGPCLVAVDVFGGQKEYMARVAQTFYPVSPDSFPFFSPQFSDVSACDTLHLTWGDVRQKLSEEGGTRVGLLVLRSDSEANQASLEKQFLTLIQIEDLYDPVAFMSFMDGSTPLVDYAAARASGVSAQHLDAVMSRHVPAYVKIPETLEPYKSSSRHAPTRRRNVLSNDPLTSVHSRQDKWNAQRLLKAHGLNHIRSIHAHTAFEAELSRLDKHILFPVVVKPVSGAGSEFVTVCNDCADLTTAFAIAKGFRTTQCTEAAHMTVEEYIDGPEYIVNTVSYDGVTVVTDVWRSFKYAMTVHSHRLRQSDVRKMQKNHELDPSAPLPTLVRTTSILYDHQEFVSNLALLPEHDEVRRVVDYTLKCVNALGMRNGASHCEVRVDDRPGSPRRGQPVLIELNPRVLGDVPRATHLVGYDQVTLLFYLAAVAAAIPEPRASAPSILLKALPWPPVPVLYTSAPRETDTKVPRPVPTLAAPGDEHTVFVVFLTVEDDGVLCGAGVHYVSALPTFVRIARGNLFSALEPNCIASVQRTADLFSSPGACIFEGPRSAVERDVAKLRVVEKTKYEKCLWVACDEILRLEVEVHKLTRAARCSSTNDKSRESVSYKSTQGSADSALSDMKAILATVKEEARLFMLQQDPPPLYISTKHFERLRACGLAVHLHI